MAGRRLRVVTALFSLFENVNLVNLALRDRIHQLDLTVNTLLQDCYKDKLRLSRFTAALYIHKQ